MNGWYFFPRASDLTPAEWEELKQTYNGRFLALWEKYAPNMTRDNVIADALYTSFEIEQEMGMREGGFGHGRPKTGTLGLEGVGDRSIGYTRTGVEGLYLCEGEQRFFVVLLNDGKCTEYYEVDEAPPRKEFDFIFEIPAAIFEEVAAGIVDPVEVGLKGTIKITGDMRILIRHADLVNVVQEVYAREVETTWPKAQPPYPNP